MKPKYIALICLLIAGLAVCACSPRRSRAQTASPSAPGYHQVIVPFELRHGNIFVDAKVNGRDIPCLVDTGTSEIVWPKSLNLGGSPAIARTPDGKTSTITFHLHTTSGGVINGEGVILPLVQVGGMNLQNMLTDCVDSQGQSMPDEMILGTRAFQQGSLSIDYANKRLVVRTAGYDASSQPLSAGDVRLPFQWFDGAPLGAGRPAVQGSVDGHPILLVIDTGANSMSIPVSFYKAHLTGKQLYQGTVSSVGQTPIPVQTVHGLTLTLGNISIPDQPAALTEGALPGGLIGYDQLNGFDVTIDYAHQMVLLQLNAPTPR